MIPPRNYRLANEIAWAMSDGVLALAALCLLRQRSRGALLFVETFLDLVNALIWDGPIPVADALKEVAGPS